MRPTPSELISGVRRILRDVVEPDLSSEYAKARLGEIRAVLAQVDWDGAGIALLRETRTLHGLLRDCLGWMDSDADRAAWFGAYRSALAEVLTDAPDGDGFSACNARKENYDAVTVRLIDPIEDWLVAHQDDSTAQELRRRLIEHYAD